MRMKLPFDRGLFHKFILYNSCIILMSLILGKYKNIKRLGKGAFGDVLLVKDEHEEEFAIKLINKKLIEKDPYLEEYLDGEKECMMSFKSQYIMRLIDFSEDEKYMYMICEYCNGGDLLNHQAKQQNKIFSLEKATEILAEIIKGLELLHQNGYIHRDIKPQNILIKYQEPDKPCYKLADFGFAKKQDDVGGTVLGTQHYMSPQIYTNDVYGFEVDMWAFGVLLYFMLNMDYPFKSNPHLSIEKKRIQLLKQSDNFSYKAAVEKSKKKLVQNCTAELQDLFSRIFTTDPEKRINWVQIREHDLFKKHFPVIAEASKILYGGKKKGDRFQEFVIRQSKIVKPPMKKKVEEVPKKQPQQTQNIDVSMLVKRKKDKNFPQEKQFIELSHEKIKFLLMSEEEMIETNQIMSPEEIYTLRYNLIRYYLYLLKGFLKNMTPEFLSKEAELKWDEFLKTKEFKDMMKEYRNEEENAELKMEALYDQCMENIEEIKSFNETMQNSLSLYIKEEQSFQTFKKAYRQSTKQAYAKMRKVLKKGNKYLYLSAIITICFAFNQIMDEEEDSLKQFFYPYLAVNKVSEKARILDFSELRHSLTVAPEEKLKEIINKVLERYFS